LHRLPTARPDQETNLEPGDVITAFFVPRGAWTRRSVFVKIRDRESYEFALASALVGLSLDDGKVKEARIALGGVATVPWRAREAEAVLTDQRLDDDSSRRSAEAAFANAKPQQNNAFKIALGKETLVRALLQAAAMEI
jgi:xanthine dehydrogenase YagS FAD-binding subunit